MNTFYLYADEYSLDVLVNEQQKVVLIGGDFGYGNFGDVLQHLNAIRFIKETGRFATISVMAANAIGFSGFPIWAKTSYGADAIIYVSEYPLIFDEHSPSLKPVGEIQNLAVIYLYGGGFLNNIWGEYVLSVVEYFLRLAPGIEYFISGQQVTPPFQAHVIDHVKKFAPKLFGVRDELSLQWLREAGLESHFSFDDATEMLIALGQRIQLQRGTGLLLHLNSSDYTANSSMQRDLGYDLTALRSMSEVKKGVTVFQAFRDVRQDVFDSIETIKTLEARFPFYDVRVIDLVGLIFSNVDKDSILTVNGAIGYSCSYHVTLWLQLAGIPCWLRSSNSYYDQKSKALQVTQALETFIQDPKLADHSINLERRANWCDLLRTELTSLVEVNNLRRIPEITGGNKPWPFFFKGTPTLQEKLASAEQQATWRRERAEVSELNLDETCRAEINVLSDRIDALNSQLTEVGHEAHLQHECAEVYKLKLDEAIAKIDVLPKSLLLKSLRFRILTTRWKYYLTYPIAAKRRYYRKILRQMTQLFELFSKVVF